MTSQALVLKLCVKCGVLKGVPSEQKRCDVCGSTLSEVQLRKPTAGLESA